MYLIVNDIWKHISNTYIPNNIKFSKMINDKMTFCQKFKSVDFCTSVWPVIKRSGFINLPESAHLFSSLVLMHNYKQRSQWQLKNLSKDNAVNWVWEHVLLDCNRKLLSKSSLLRYLFLTSTIEESQSVWGYI